MSLPPASASTSSSDTMKCVASKCRGRVRTKEIAGNETVLVFLPEPPRLSFRPVSIVGTIARWIGIQVPPYGMGACSQPCAFLDHERAGIGTHKFLEHRAAVLIADGL